MAGRRRVNNYGKGKAFLRGDGERRFSFLLNFTTTSQTIELQKDEVLREMTTGTMLGGSVTLPPYGSGVYALNTD